MESIVLNDMFWPLWINIGLEAIYL